MKIVEWLRKVNQVRDDLLIEIASTLLLIGFVIGTIDVLTRGNLTTNEYFQTGWAIVQALTVDTLFFALWSRVGRASWRLDFKLIVQNGILIVAGILLLAVVVLVNGLVNLQQLMNLPSMQDTMQQLGIDLTVFTLARSALMGLLGVLLAIVGRMGSVQTEARGKATIIEMKTEAEDKAQSAAAVTSEAGQSSERRSARKVVAPSQVPTF